jgi:ABC-type branched-subunit amino acid transport system permease subunit
MPPLGRVGIDLLAAYLVLNIVAGYGFDKDTGKPSETWTIIGLIVAALVVLALELHARRQAHSRGPDRRR